MSYKNIVAMYGTNNLKVRDANVIEIYKIKESLRKSAKGAQSVTSLYVQFYPQEITE